MISTIGYGNIAPSTTAGKWFTIVFSLIGIPLVLTAVGICASEVLYVFEVMAVAKMDQVTEAFKVYDVDHSGELDLQEFRDALNDLGIEPSDAQFVQLIYEIDDGSGKIDLSEFKQCAARLKLPVGKAARTKVRLQISVAVSIMWLIAGASAIAALEDWVYIDAFYFCVITLTTVGLGDFVPSTDWGIKFGFFYCMVSHKLSPSYMYLVLVCATIATYTCATSVYYSTIQTTNCN